MPAVLTIRPPAVSPVDYSPSSCEAGKLLSKYPAVNAPRTEPQKSLRRIRYPGSSHARRAELIRINLDV